jgi:predicted membrane protein DUF2306
MAVTAPPRSAHPARTLAVPLGLLTVLFLAYALPPYLGLDPTAARFAVPEAAPWFYPALVAHIGFGSIALLTASLQVWPWLRSAHPGVHRWSGRTYVFLGALPTSLFALTIAPFTVNGGAVSHVGNTLGALLWAGTTVAGYRAARDRRFGAHREWMVRSIAIAFSIVANRLWVMLCIAVFSPSVLGTGDVVLADLDQAIGLASWLSLVVNLLLAESWLQRTRRRGDGVEQPRGRAAAGAPVRRGDHRLRAGRRDLR